MKLQPHIKSPANLGRILGLAMGLLGAAVPAGAQLVVSDTLTGTSSSYSWKAINGACLTAGNNTGSIPACVGLPYYSGKTLVGGVTGTLPDPVGQGALRLTNGDTTLNGSNGNNQTGAVVSTVPFPATQGIQVTFSTRTYGGNGYTNGSSQKSGADGITFFLLNGGTPSSPATPSIGAYGGSLGYSCAQGKNPANGVVKGYLGVGIDEFGNFINPGDNTASGPGVSPGYVGVRGAGDISWTSLNANYPSYYPSSLSASSQLTAVQNTCSSGYLWNYSGKTIVDANGKSINNASQTTQTVLDYPYLASSKVTVPIYNQEAQTTSLRGNANVLTYQLNISQSGVLDLNYSANGGAPVPVLSQFQITANNGLLPSYFLFGFSAGTGGGSNVHEITCFKAAQANVAASSATSNTQQSGKVQTGSQVYFSFYHPTNWWGQVTAYGLTTNATTGALGLTTYANWDANCDLTGGSCSSTNGSNTALSPSSRTMLTWSGTAGIPFESANLTTAQTAVMDSTTLSYLRGNRSNEITVSNPNGQRARTGVLGDIIDSSPAVVGPPSAPYGSANQVDLITQAAVPEFGTSYSNFSTQYATRTNMVYAGANDGFLHGFRSGAFDANGNWAPSASSPNDGLEVLAYMPAAVLNIIHQPNTPSLDYPNALYAHNAYVDATPGTGDLYYKGAWHTWVVGGLGPGGNLNGVVADNTSTTSSALYALDVTNPANFSESKAASLVIGEWNNTSLSCTNLSTCYAYMGSIYGTPLIRRLHDGNWAAIFGNGRNSAKGAAGIFIMTVNNSTGAITFRYLDTGTKYASTTNKNAIDQVSSADIDGDHITDYIYAGDAWGNLWRFDLTSSNPSNWAVGSAPVFTAPLAQAATQTTAAVYQAISTRPTVSLVNSTTGGARVIVNFGTGRQMPQTLSSGVTYGAGSYALYGVWDWNMTAWNALKSTQVASLTATAATGLTGGSTITPSNLLTQTMTTNGGTRTVSTNPVCWQGSTVCTGTNNQYGWALNLSGNNEQIVFNPALLGGFFTVNTLIPAQASAALSCDNPTPTGFSMAILPDSGAQSASAGFVTGTNTFVAGLSLGATGTSVLMTSLTLGSNKLYPQAIVAQGQNGNPVIASFQQNYTGNSGRLSWIKLR